MISPGVEELSASECWRLLRTVEVGRLAVTVDGSPDIFPINFVVDHGTLVFRTAAGTKLAAALAGGAVAIEADGVDQTPTKAWSVVIKGGAREISGLHALVDSFDLPLFPWHDGAKNRFVRVTPSTVTGRRFPVVEASRWEHPLSHVRRGSPE